ncbi:hypothetical protein HPP92_016506 [Vanilla planifolia]|uniref:Uncharacterized protein n=1 Tax=Vanilla planifolia TaxID=51239 RepID=A0A835QK76_VANPL|nr:hypothetical protein HPP92_017094 [Vanilla planifolia]KAG0471960.1 hypothetical protein HPP92_016506 [Vanilla planifolia]
MNKESSSSSITSKSTPNKSPGDAEFGVENSAEQCSMTCSNSVVINNVGCNSPREDLIPESNQLENSLAPLNFVASNVSSRTMPSIGAFAVQCALCFKWRLIPTKEKYEQIRGSILQIPFVCEVAHEWHADLSCDDPEDISQDGSRVWAIDKPNIAQPPSGWSRELRIRGEGSTKFADVYYVAPSGKRLRSLVEVQKYLEEHAEFAAQGVTLSQFSFQTPRPLQQNYVKKKSSRVQHTTSVSVSGLTGPPEVDEGSRVHDELDIGGPKQTQTVNLLPDESPSRAKKRSAKEGIQRPSYSRKYGSNGSSVYEANSSAFEDAQIAINEASNGEL